LRILSIRPAAGTKVVAHFDVEVDEHLRMFNLELRQMPDGQLRSFAPKSSGKHAASFHPSLATEITRAAAVALKGMQPDGTTRN
jgi:hypothetical protein